MTPGRRRPRRPARARVWGSLAAFAVVLASCGSERTVQAFCSSYHEETGRLAEKYDQRAALAESEGGLVGLGVAFGSLVEAQGDLVVLFDRLEANAPEDIAPDVRAVRDALRTQADAAASGDLLQMFVGSVMPALQANGSANRVDAYLQQHCGVGR